jgi:3-phosphoshikimate 1-carboxyvinyltransferase
LPSEEIDVGNSGTTLRVAVGSVSLCEENEVIKFTGDEQIRSRPIDLLLNSLNELGANCRSVMNNGKAPLEVRGKLTGGKTELQCPTSQYLTSLLLCGPLASGDIEINVTVLNEPGYVQMTLDWLDKQGIVYENEGMCKFFLKGNQKFKHFDEAVPADFSSATFFLCAGAIAGDNLRIEGLDFDDSQPDKAVVDYLKEMGADIRISDDAVIVNRSDLQGCEVDMNVTPDALPAMAVTACFAQGKTRLVNVPQARMKETDRISCMAKNLSKLGVEVEELADGLVITGGGSKGGDICGYGDHRIVMAGSLAGLSCEEQVRVDTAEAMNITFPTYVELMQDLGGDINLE